MRTESFLLSTAALAVAGCTVQVTVPELASPHPADPSAAVAPLTPASSILEFERTPRNRPPAGVERAPMEGMSHQGMDQGSMDEMPQHHDH